MISNGDQRTLIRAVGRAVRNRLSKIKVLPPYVHNEVAVPKVENVVEPAQVVVNVDMRPVAEAISVLANAVGRLIDDQRQFMVNLKPEPPIVNVKLPAEKMALAVAEGLAQQLSLIGESLLALRVIVANSQARTGATDRVVIFKHADGTESKAFVTSPEE